MAPKGLLENRLTKDNFIQVIADRFPGGVEHYVCNMEDNYIAKEFMSSVYNEAEVYLPVKDAAKS